MLADTMNASSAAAGTALICGAALPFVALAYTNLTSKKTKTSTKTDADASTSCTCCHADLKQHSKVFEKQILHIPDTNIHVAIGYSLANCILIEGDDGIVVIDTTESPASAKDILKDYRAITNLDKPVAAIIYTHFHHDHVAGTPAFLEGIEDKNIPIYAHHSTEDRISQFNSVMGPIAFE